jgi:hypothetical protein
MKLYSIHGTDTFLNSLNKFVSYYKHCVFVSMYYPFGFIRIMYPGAVNLQLGWLTDYPEPPQPQKLPLPTETSRTVPPIRTFVTMASGTHTGQGSTRFYYDPHNKVVIIPCNKDFFYPTLYSLPIFGPFPVRPEAALP